MSRDFSSSWCYVNAGRHTPACADVAEPVGGGDDTGVMAFVVTAVMGPRTTLIVPSFSIVHFFGVVLEVKARDQRRGPLWLAEIHAADLVLKLPLLDVPLAVLALLCRRRCTGCW